MISLKIKLFSDYKIQSHFQLTHKLPSLVKNKIKNKFFWDEREKETLIKNLHVYLKKKPNPP